MQIVDRNKRHLVIAMDHGRAMGAVPGLEDPKRVIETVIEAGADAIMTSYGIVKRYGPDMAERADVYLRLDGGVSIVAEAWLRSHDWQLLHDVQQARELAVDGVCVMYFMGAPCEMSTLQNLADTTAEAADFDLPVMCEALPCPHENIPDPTDPQMMADACRIAFEHGADILKTYYTGTPDGFRKVTGGTPAPVLIAGGPKVDSDEEVLELVRGSIEAGGKGVVYGRNIWQSPNPAGMVKALRAVIHDDATAAQAAKLLRD